MRDEIEAALVAVSAEGGVRQLAIDGDEKVWVHWTRSAYARAIRSSSISAPERPAPLLLIPPA